MRALRALILLCLPVFAWAQDRAGNDTPGEWIVDHYKAFGLWDSICDHRITGQDTEERCYLRYVEVFSPAPKFAAQFAFVTPEPKVTFGMEAGTRYTDAGFRILSEGQPTWSAPQAGCLVGLACIYEAAEADRLLSAMSEGQVFAFDFTDRHGQQQSLRWDLSRFGAALSDFRAQSERRGLPAD